MYILRQFYLYLFDELENNKKTKKKYSYKS